jgi:hypothetical protein
VNCGQTVRRRPSEGGFVGRSSGDQALIRENPELSAEITTKVRKALGIGTPDLQVIG